MVMIYQNPSSWLLVLGVLFICNTFVNARPLTPFDVVTMPRPDIPSISPDGRFAVFDESVYHEKEDYITTTLELIDLQSDDGKDGRSRRLTTPKIGANQREPIFLDNEHICYFEHRENEPIDQIYVLNIYGNHEPLKLTDFPIEFANIKYNAKKRLLSFSAKVYKDEPTLDGSKAKFEILKKTKKDSALVYDQLMVRHWDAYVSELKNNIFVVQLTVSPNGSYKVVGKPHNLMAGSGLESPDLPFGDASDYDISPDGDELAFVSKTQTPDNAWQSSKHVYIVPIGGSTNQKPIAINDDIPAASATPKYAPSGKTLAYLQMFVPQYEADKNRIILYDRATGHKSILAESWDRSPLSVQFSPDSSIIYSTAEDYGRQRIFAIDTQTDKVRPLTENHSATSISVVPSSGTLVFSLQSTRFPNLVHTLDPSSMSIVEQQLQIKSHGMSTQLFEALGKLEMLEPEEFEFTGDLDDSVHGWIIKPPNFDPNIKYPVAFLIHGGPQGSWDDVWSNRWNMQVFSGAGFVTVAINFHGSFGYGQKFCDSIQKNWGSYPFHDLEKGLDYLFETHSFLDSNRVAALGGSYGGYMVNWINGHSNRFKALVNHDGTFDTVGQYYGTDELYFHEQEFGGVPFDPSSRAIYEQWSPSNYVQNWKTPTLIIHGVNDFRIPITEGLSTFTALQRQGIPSRLLIFPDENHWVSKPANSLRWYMEVISWITKWTKDE
ncbi:Alpha/Beta hydrolase protein [Phascolomyces articulosus]|uniref:Dipeptidyl-peptidase V n=1 Tax=Phascolomyces articulosus TaxID=60185 RepID=A0AAD5JMT7_9FUNG|nr:Alpha/Beta hydrolase protein [Phascolomyces articulosus]